MTCRYRIDPDRIAANQRRNMVHAALLIAAMAGLFAAVGWFMAGLVGVLILSGFAVLVLTVGPRASRRLLLQIYSAQHLKRHQVPLLYDLVETLRKRADLARTIELYYIPSRLMLAFTIASRDGVSLAVSDGLLRRLNGREIAGVLAHELSHVAHHDITLMALADFITKVTRSLAFIALILLMINLPYIMENEAAIPWPPIVLLALSPLLSLLLQLGLSRAREYDADTGAALLTGDPEGIASALQKMNAQQQLYAETVFGRQGVVDQPSLLRTHPKTEARIAALAGMARKVDSDDLPDIPDELLPPDADGIARPPRRRFHGFRY